MPDTVFTVVLISFFVFVGAVIAIASASGVKRKKNEQTQREYSQRFKANGNTLNSTKTSSSSSSTDRQHEYNRNLRDSQSQKYDTHQLDARRHAHLGEEEHYDDIVGSLGEVYDEGCADLRGVRFVAHDLAYEVSNSEQPNYNKLAQAIVLGEVLNNPRFKTPYSPKK